MCVRVELYGRDCECKNRIAWERLCVRVENCMGEIVSVRVELHGRDCVCKSRELYGRDCECV